MTAEIIDGRAIADAVMTGLAEQIRALGESPHLAAICVGDDMGLRAFIKLKQKAAQSVGIQFSSYFFDANDEDGARQTLQYLAGDESVHGIFVELPLPSDWNTDHLLAIIPAEKDVDALTAGARVPAPAVRALEYVLQEYEIGVRGMSVTVVGYGRLIGRPIAKWLHEQDAQVSIIDVDTPEPATTAAHAQLIVSGVGEPGLVTGDWVAQDATVVDFGYANGKGDVDFDSVHKKADLLTPVPGGMGPLVVAAVLENLIALATQA